MALPIKSTRDLGRQWATPSAKYQDGGKEREEVITYQVSMTTTSFQIQDSRQQHLT